MKPLDALFPKQCVFCGGRYDGGICEKCRSGLPWHGEPETLGNTLNVTAPLIYENSARAALLRFKFKGKTRYAKTFAELMAVCVRNHLGAFDAIVYIPLSFLRRLGRGYNQSKLLAEALSRELGRTPVTALLRKRRRRANSSLGRGERAVNIKNAFVLKRGTNIAGKRILLVDDVLTTGATLTECASVLLAAGAENVCAVTVCRTEKLI